MRLSTSREMVYIPEQLGESAATRQNLLLTSQDGTTPSFFPYNSTQRPRRLDYVLIRGLRAESEGEVLQKTRTMMGSDRDAVALRLSWRLEFQPHRPSPTAPRYLKLGDHSQLLHLRTEVTCEWIQHTSEKITQVKRNKGGFVESQELKALRLNARGTADPKEATALWKKVWKARRIERRRYDEDLAREAIQRDWAALRAIRSRPARQCQSPLLSQDDWEQGAVRHFEGIFARDDDGERRLRLSQLRHRLLHMCKRTPFNFFTREEITSTSTTWKKGKSTGPDGVPYEAMHGIIAEGDSWINKPADMYSDALYKGYLPNTSDSITTLLAKKISPQNWGDTRPITLSCVAQLLLGRARDDPVDPTGMQWSERGKQTGEVIFALRRISRMALSWGKPIYVLKLDIRKAFDSAVQARLGELIFKKVAAQGVNRGRLDYGYNWLSVRNCWCKQMEETCPSSKQMESDKGHRTHRFCLLHSWEKPLGPSWNTLMVGGQTVPVHGPSHNVKVLGSTFTMGCSKKHELPLQATRQPSRAKAP